MMMLLMKYLLSVKVFPRRRQRRLATQGDAAERQESGASNQSPFSLKEKNQKRIYLKEINQIA
jgi:hypothetical protein